MYREWKQKTLQMYQDKNNPRTHPTPPTKGEREREKKRKEKDWKTFWLFWSKHIWNLKTKKEKDTFTTAFSTMSSTKQNEQTNKKHFDCDDCRKNMIFFFKRGKKKKNSTQNSIWTAHSVKTNYAHIFNQPSQFTFKGKEKLNGWIQHCSTEYSRFSKIFW